MKDLHHLTEDFDGGYDAGDWKEKRAQRETLEILYSGRSVRRYAKILRALNYAAGNIKTEQTGRSDQTCMRYSGNLIRRRS